MLDGDGPVAEMRMDRLGGFGPGQGPVDGVRLLGQQALPRAQVLHLPGQARRRRAGVPRGATVGLRLADSGLRRLFDATSGAAFPPLS